MTNIALVTGASSGIGRAVAKRLAGEGYRVIALARRRDRLNSLRDDVQKEGGAEVLPLVTDVRKYEDVHSAISNLPDEWSNISVLVNNAGLARGLSEFCSSSIEDIDEMIDTNIKGLLYVSRAVLERMIRNKTGHVINIGSIAGRQVYPNGIVYCATKHAVRAITAGLRIELLKYGIRVSEIAPGLVETEFSLVRFKGDVERARKTYSTFRPLKPDDIADVVIYCIKRPEHVNVNDILVMPSDQADINYNVTKV